MSPCQRWQFCHTAVRVRVMTCGAFKCVQIVPLLCPSLLASCLSHCSQLNKVHEANCMKDVPLSGGGGGNVSHTTDTHHSYEPQPQCTASTSFRTHTSQPPHFQHCLTTVSQRPSIYFPRQHETPRCNAFTASEDVVMGLLSPPYLRVRTPHKPHT